MLSHHLPHRLIRPIKPDPCTVKYPEAGAYDDFLLGDNVCSITSYTEQYIRSSTLLKRARMVHFSRPLMLQEYAVFYSKIV